MRGKGLFGGGFGRGGKVGGVEEVFLREEGEDLGVGLFGEGEFGHLKGSKGADGFKENGGRDVVHFEDEGVVFNFEIIGVLKAAELIMLSGG